MKLFAMPVLALAMVGAGSAPALTVQGHNPLVVSGKGFRAAERVTVTLRAAQPYVHHVTASPRGTFTTRFQSVQYSPCAVYHVTATGTRGSRALFHGPRPVCVNRGGPSG